MKHLTMLFILAFLSGCEATPAYTTGQTINSITFNAALERVCDPIASLAAARELTPDANAALNMLCEEIGRRP